MINITILGEAHPAPSNASDTNWAATQVALEQALAAAINGLSIDLTELQADVEALEESVEALETTTFEPLGMSGSWANIPSGVPLEVTVDPAGWVGLRGDIAGGAAPAVATLGSDFTPGYTQSFPIVCGLGRDMVAIVTIADNGDVTVIPADGVSPSEVYDATFINVRFNIH